MDYRNRSDRQRMAHRAANGMGWFSIGLGITELLFARPLARWMGMRGQEDTLRFYGVRELGAGIGLLLAKEKAPWMWGRVAGDALDIATLAAQFEGNPRKPQLVAALAAVAGATMADVVTARELSTRKQLPRAAVRDYSMRSGFPMGVEAVRGAAAKDFSTPDNYRASLPQPGGSLH